MADFYKFLVDFAAGINIGFLLLSVGTMQSRGWKIRGVGALGVAGFFCFGSIPWLESWCISVCAAGMAIVAAGGWWQSRAGIKCNCFGEMNSVLEKHIGWIRIVILASAACWFVHLAVNPDILARGASARLEFGLGTAFIYFMEMVRRNHEPVPTDDTEEIDLDVDWSAVPLMQGGEATGSVADYLLENGSVLILFGSPTCEACQKLISRLQRLAAYLGRGLPLILSGYSPNAYEFSTIHPKHAKQLQSAFSIKGFPTATTLVLRKDGMLIADTSVGLLKIFSRMLELHFIFLGNEEASSSDMTGHASGTGEMPVTGA